MAQNTFALMTNLGRAKEAAAIANGTAVVITHIAIGDGTTVPSGGETTLYHEVARKAISGHGTVVGASNVAYFDIFLEADEGPFTIRESGLIDQDGDLIAIARYDPPISKPIPSSGQTVEGTIRLEVAFSNVANITIVVDPAFKVEMQRLSRLPWLPVISMSETAPPSFPAVGDVYVVPNGASGAWSGQAGKIAEYTVAGWAVISPPNGHGVSLPDGRVFEKTGGAYVEKLALDVQSGRWIYAEAGGSANALTAVLMPIPSTLTAGMGVRLKIGSLNTGPVTLNVNGTGAKPVVNRFGGALVGSELVGVVDFIFDGVQFWSGVTQPALSADRSYYVNSVTGNDSNNGLTAGTAYATIQKAINVASALNLNGYTATINVADGSYASFTTTRAASGGEIVIKGNNAAPQNVIIGPTMGKTGIAIIHAGYSVAGFSPRGANGEHNISVLGTSCTIGTMHHAGTPGGAHIACGAGGAIYLTGDHYIAGGASVAHLYAADGGVIRSGNTLPTMTFTAQSLGFGAFVVATNGNINARYSNFSEPGNATGPRYNATLNGVINTNGGGANYYPGSVAGTIATGGIYA